MNNYSNMLDRLSIKCVSVSVILFAISACTSSTASHQEQSEAGVISVTAPTDAAGIDEGLPVSAELSGNAELLLAGSEKQSSLNVDNYRTTVDYVIGLFNGSNIESKTLGIDSLFANVAPVNQSLEYLTSASYQRLRTQSDYRCDNDGSASVITISADVDAPPEEFYYQFTDCQWGSEHYGGNLLVRLTTPTIYRDYDELTIESDSGEFFQLTGITGSGDLCADHQLGGWSAEIEYFESKNDQGKTVIVDTKSRLGYGVNCRARSVAYLDGALSITAPETNNSWLTVSTPVVFENTLSADLHFPVGTMNIRADDGSEIVVEANNGEILTVDVSLVTDDFTERSSMEWVRWFGNMTSHRYP